MATTNPANVASDCPTDRYFGATGTPVQADRNFTLGGKGQAFGFTNNPTEVEYGAKNAPVIKD